MGVRFGTDGIRGVANGGLGAELVLALGRAAARAMPAPRFLVGRDTRRSGPLLQAALSAGLASEGADVIDVGVLPTPGVAWLSARHGVPAAVVSASHNAFEDNGVKFFAAGGLKLPDATEHAIERQLDALVGGPGALSQLPTGYGVGTLRADPDAGRAYVDWLAGALAGRDLRGMRVVIDCANGAASAVAPEVLARLGVDVHALACTPDGTNINEGCGSTHPEQLAASVLDLGADAGLALDGDADRVIAVDDAGTIATGDEMLVLFARDMARRGELPSNVVVVTVMSNLGLRLALAEQGIAVRETPVGDRHVLEALDAEGLGLGGEQSGHLVFRDRATTGDGVLTGLLLLDLVRRSGRRLSDLVGGAMRRLPQLLDNVAAPDPAAAVADPRLGVEVAAVQAELGERGRVVLRASGTEPLVRVMVEAEHETTASEALARLCAAVRRVVEGSPSATAAP